MNKAMTVLLEYQHKDKIRKALLREYNDDYIIEYYYYDDLYDKQIFTDTDLEKIKEIVYSWSIGQ